MLYSQFYGHNIEVDGSGLYVWETAKNYSVVEQWFNTTGGRDNWVGQTENGQPVLVCEKNHCPGKCLEK